MAAGSQLVDDRSDILAVTLVIVARRGGGLASRKPTRVSRGCFYILRCTVMDGLENIKESTRARAAFLDLDSEGWGWENTYIDCGFGHDNNDVQI